MRPVVAPLPAPRRRVAAAHLHRVLAGLALAGLVLAGCGGSALPGASRPLASLLDVLPAGALAGGAFVTDLQAVRDAGGGTGFGADLPLAAAAAAFGFDEQAVRAVAEAGRPPVTLLAVDVDPGDVAQAAVDQGYAGEEVAGWRVLRRGPAVAGAPPVVAAVPALAVRRGLVVLGGAEQVQAVVDGTEPAGAVPWVHRLLAAAGPEAAAVALGPMPAPPAATSSPPPAWVQEADLGRYDGWAIAWAPPEEPGEDPTGVIALAYPTGAGADEPAGLPAGGGPAAATALATRVALAGTAGDPTRPLGEDLEQGAPRWFAEEAVVRLPVVWHRFDGPALRRLAERDALDLLHPGPA